MVFCLLHPGMRSRGGYAAPSCIPAKQSTWACRMVPGGGKPPPGKGEEKAYLKISRQWSWIAVWLVASASVSATK